MGLPPNRMDAYRAARAAEAQAAPVQSTSILDLGPDAFVAALDELGLPPEERAFVEQQYFARSRALPMTERPEGKRVGMVAPIAFPEGMTGAEALMSGDFEFTAPEFLRGIYEAPAEAANVVRAATSGVPVTKDQLQQAATTTAEMVTGIGPVTFAGRSLVRGVEMPDASTVSMSGVRGIGDNGGPELEQFDENGFLRLDDVPAAPPRRYINPNTGLYSPSFEAAKSLTQEVGTPQQMRAMLLKGGAKEEELVYSGFDDWLKGKDRVTKQEIEDVLFDSAAGFGTGNMPYARESYLARGVTGVQDMDLGSLQDRIAQDLRRQAIDERNARMDSELLGRGYRPIQFADEGEYRQMADQVRALYNNPESRGGLGPEGNRLPPARVMNAITQIDAMMRRQGRPFEDREIQRILNSLADDSDYILGPSGLPEFTDEVVRRELPDFASNPYYGSLPMDTVSDIEDRVRAMSEQEVADQLGISVEDMLNTFRSEDTEYGGYAPEGLRNYSENLYKFDDAGRGVLSGIEALGVQRFNQPHFPRKGGERTPTMFHTRTGELLTAEGPAYHVAEIQSDIGQRYREDPKAFFVPGSTEDVPKLTKQQKSILQTYVDEGKRFRELNQEAENSLNRLYDGYFDYDEGVWKSDAPGYEDAKNEVIALRGQANAARKSVLDMEEQNWDFLYGDLANTYQTPRLMTTVDSLSLPTADFDPGEFEAILAGTAKPRTSGRRRTAALPFATSTNRWVDAALKNELINAAKSGAEWFTLPMGEDVAKYTYGEVEGQKKFYEGIVPTRLKEISKKFLDGAEIQQIEATGFGPNKPTYRVNAIRMTPELRTKLLEEGLPSFAKGGPVSGSSLDVDVFAFR